MTDLRKDESVKVRDVLKNVLAIDPIPFTNIFCPTMHHYSENAYVLMFFANVKNMYLYIYIYK